MFEKLDERVAIVARADALLRHFGAGRIAGRTYLEQFRQRLGRPYDAEMLEGFGIIVAGEAGDPPSENAVQTGAIALVGSPRMASHAAPKHLSPGFAVTT